MRRSRWCETTILAALTVALAAGCGGSSDTTGKGGAGGQAGGAAGSGGQAGGAAGAGGGPSCTIATIAGSCASTPTAAGSYRCSETSVDLSTSCPGMGAMTWTAGASCPTGALYCCTSASGNVLSCFYGRWSDTGGDEATARAACADAHGSWCPR